MYLCVMTILSSCSLGLSIKLLPPGMKAGLYSSAIGQADWTLNVHPPEEAPEQLDHAVDAIARIEDAKAANAEMEFASAKQKMLDSEKEDIADIVKQEFTRARLALSYS